MADLTGKTIAELPEDTYFSGNELFPVMDGSTSKKVPYPLLRSQSLQINGGVVISEATDLNDLTSSGTYYVNNLALVTNGPSTSYAYKLVVLKASPAGYTARFWQIAYVMNNGCTEYRRNCNDGTWSDWVRFDIGSTNSRLDAIEGGAIGSVASISKVTVASNASETVDFTGRALLVISGPISGIHGVYTLYQYSTGTTVVVAVKEAGSSLTVTGGVGNITIANGYGYGAYCMFIAF